MGKFSDCPKLSEACPQGIPLFVLDLNVPNEPKTEDFSKYCRNSKPINLLPK